MSSMLEQSNQNEHDALTVDAFPLLSRCGTPASKPPDDSPPPLFVWGRPSDNSKSYRQSSNANRIVRRPRPLSPSHPTHIGYADRYALISKFRPASTLRNRPASTSVSLHAENKVSSEDPRAKSTATGIIKPRSSNQQTCLASSLLPRFLRSILGVSCRNCRRLKTTPERQRWVHLR